jgi:hypothetical protein
MLLSDDAILGFVMCSSILIFDALLGKLRLRQYFQVGVPLGSMGLAADAQSVATKAMAMTRVRVHVCELPGGTYGLRYGFLGNWLPSFTKGVLRPAGADKSVFSISLNLGATALLGALTVQLFYREDLVLWGFLLAMVVLLVWFQRTETITGLRKALG